MKKIILGHCFRFIFLALLFLPTTNTFAVPAVPAKISSWQSIPNGKARFFKLENIPNSMNFDRQFGLEVHLASEWHSYWHNPGDSGAAPLFFAVTGSEKTKLEKIIYTFPERIRVGPLVTYGYSEKVIYFFEHKEKNTESLLAELLVCKEECVPAYIKLPLKDLLKASPQIDKEFSVFLQEQIKKIPTSLPIESHYSLTQTGSQWNLQLPEGYKLRELFWHPEQVNSLEKPNIVEKSQRQYSFYGDLLSGMDQKNDKKALLVLEKKGQFFSVEAFFKKQSPSLWTFIFMAILGGFILNLMPCVFPIVSLKAFSIASSSGKELSSIRVSNLFYCLGVIVCFIGLALLISLLRASGNFVGWGFQLQTPWFVFSLAALFVVMGLNFFDVWSWNWLPSFVSKPMQGGGPGASFMTGLLAVIVASPCTGPFMGAAIGFAISQSLPAIFAIFFGLAIGMSSPFLLLAVFPSFSKLLPRPGKWMLVFKKFMGLLMIATAIWLIWVGQQTLATSSRGAAEQNNIWTELKIEDWQDMQKKPEAKFVNFTADWCVTCKVNERLVFASPDVLDFFRAQNIKTYKVDWTKRQGKIGEKLAEYGRVGIPLYLFYEKGSDTPQILPELLTPELLMGRIGGQK